MKDTPVFIVAKDRVTYLSCLVEKLRSQGYTNLHIVDTGSTWPPMLEYLGRCHVPVHHCRPKRVPKLALWSCGVLKEVSPTGHYLYTDCDILPDCPDDWAEILKSALDVHPSVAKAGLGLRIDDLPDCYERKRAVIRWENQFWAHPLGQNLYRASVDTTMALYRPGSGYSLKAVRTGGDYQARHLPWYEDSRNPTPEKIYYLQHLDKTAMAYWTRGVHPLTR